MLNNQTIVYNNPFSGFDFRKTSETERRPRPQASWNWNKDRYHTKSGFRDRGGGGGVVLKTDHETYDTAI